MKNNKDINLFLDQFYKIIYVDFGIEVLNDKIRNWHQLTWDEFKGELLKLKVKINTPVLRDWEYFFHHHKNKISNLK